MNLDELRAFVAVVEGGSFVAGARMLNWPRSTVRRRIDELEARTNTSLLVRGRDGATVTPAGKIVAERSRGILENVNAMMSGVRGLEARPDGAVRVLMPAGLSPYVFSGLARLMRATFPDLALHVRSAEDPLAQVLDSLDCVACLAPALPEGPWRAWRVRTLRERLLASDAYLSRHGEPTTVQDLDSHALLCWKPPGALPIGLPLADGTTREVRPVLASNDIAYLRQCAEDGHGLVLLPDETLPPPAQPGTRLRPVLDAEVGRDWQVCIVVPNPVADKDWIQPLIDVFLKLQATVGAGHP
ncbi:MAG: LysR family transcriptional regulator [Myxococcota bacterium]